MASGAVSSAAVGAGSGGAGVAAGSVASAGATTTGAASGLLGPTPPPPLLTPIVFCLPHEGASRSLAALASTSAAAVSSESAGSSSSAAAAAAAAPDAGEVTGTEPGNGTSKALPAALLPVANRPLIAFALQQLVSAGLRHAVVCAPAAQHSLFAHTLRQLSLAPPLTSSSTSTSTPNVQVLIDPLPGTSRRATPSANTYVLRLDLVPLGPLDRTDKTRAPATGPSAAGPAPPSSQTASVPQKGARKARSLGSAELLLWLASEGWLEADPLILPYDLLTPSLPLAALIRAHQISSALLPSTAVTPGYAPANSVPAQSLLLGATTLLIEKRTPANTRSKAVQADAVSKERLKAERKGFAEHSGQADRLVVYGKQDFGAQHGFHSSTLIAPHTGAFISTTSPASSSNSLVTEAPHSVHSLLFSEPLGKVQAKSNSASFQLPPSVGRRTLQAGGQHAATAQGSIVASANVSINLQDSGLYILPRAIALPLLERFSAPQSPKIRTVPHLVSLLARASSDTAYARKLGVDTLARRITRSYAQTHAERAGLGLPIVVGARGAGGMDVGGVGGGLQSSTVGLSGGGGAGGGGLADSLVLGSAAGTGNATPGVLSSPVTGGGGTRSNPHGLLASAGGAADAQPDAKGPSGSGSSDPLLAGLEAGMSRLSVSIAAAHSSASRSSLTGERGTTAIRHFTDVGNGGGVSVPPAEIRVQALIARLETDAETFVLGAVEDAAQGGAGAAQSGGGKGKGNAQGANAAKALETERFLGRVDTPARYLEANKFLLRALSAPLASPLFPIPGISDAGSLGAAPPVDSSASGAPAQPQITPDALIASSTSVTLGDRCVVRRSVVGKGCHIARGAKILGCVLLPGVSVGENAKLESCVLAPHTVVGARASLLDVDAGPDGIRIPDGTEAKVKVFGPASAAAAAGGSKKGGGKAQALGFDDMAVPGLVQGDFDDDDDDDDEDEEEDESEEEDSDDE